MESTLKLLISNPNVMIAYNAALKVYKLKKE